MCVPGTMLGAGTQPGVLIDHLPVLMDVTVQTLESNSTVTRAITNGGQCCVGNCQVP